MRDLPQRDGLVLILPQFDPLLDGLRTPVTVAMAQTVWLWQVHGQKGPNRGL